MDPGGLAPFHLKEVSLREIHPPKIRATEETVAGDEKGWKGLRHLARVDSDSLVDLSIMNLGVKKQVSSRNFHKKTRCTTFEGFTSV